MHARGLELDGSESFETTVDGSGPVLISPRHKLESFSKAFEQSKGARYQARNREGWVEKENPVCHINSYAKEICDNLSRLNLEPTKRYALRKLNSIRACPHGSLKPALHSQFEDIMLHPRATKLPFHATSVVEMPILNSPMPAVPESSHHADIPLQAKRILPLIVPIPSTPRSPSSSASSPATSSSITLLLVVLLLRISRRRTFRMTHRECRSRQPVREVDLRANGVGEVGD